MKNRKVLILTGPTASGKTDLAIRLAQSLNTEIISVDSRLVYKDFNIGTAKPTIEELSAVKHHLIDIVEPTFNYTVALYKNDARKIIDNLHLENRIPILAGGTGLYIRAAIEELNIPEVKPDVGYRNYLKQLVLDEGNTFVHDMLRQVDEQSAQRLHPNDILRIIRALEVYKHTGEPLSKLQTRGESIYKPIYIGLTSNERDFLYRRINQRVFDMIESGLVDEVKSLVNKYDRTLSILKTIGYKEVIAYFDGQTSFNTMIEEIQANTRRFAKRQLIWFRADERIKWYYIDVDSKEDIIAGILKSIKDYDG